MTNFAVKSYFIGFFESDEVSDPHGKEALLRHIAP